MSSFPFIFLFSIVIYVLFFPFDMNQLYSKSKLIRALKHSTFSITHANETSTELYSAIQVLYNVCVPKLIKYLNT